MIDFEYCCPTKIIFGKDSLNKIGAELESRNAKKILVVYGSKRIEQNGLLNKVKEQISYAKAQYFQLNSIRPNPVIEDVKKGIEIVRNNQIDFILAVGGGSVIDSAKLIATGSLYDGDPFDISLHKVKPAKGLPIGVVLTIASAGSELSDSCVIQDDKAQIKMGYNSPFNRPVFAVEDPTLSFSVPKYQTAVGIADTIMHSFERYFNESDEYQLSDDFALAVIKKTMLSGDKVLENPEDYEARATLMLCSSLSHNGITSIGKLAPFMVHPIEHGLSGYKSDIVHGAGVALIFPAWAEYTFENNLAKFVRVTKFIFNKECKTDKETAIMGINLFREYFSKIGMPSSLKDVGLSKNDIPAIADLVTDNGTRVIGRYPKSLNREDIKNILLKLS